MTAHKKTAEYKLLCLERNIGLCDLLSIDFKIIHILTLFN